MINRVARGILILMLISALQNTALAETENYCSDPESWKQWNELVQKHPNDLEVQALHALRIGLCVKIENGSTTPEQAIEIFETARETIFENKKAMRDREKDKRNL